MAVARVLDRGWGKMAALIVVAYHTGLRVGSILAASGKDLDLDAGTPTVPRTKNGDPIIAGLSSGVPHLMVTAAPMRDRSERELHQGLPVAARRAACRHPCARHPRGRGARAHAGVDRAPGRGCVGYFGRGGSPRNFALSRAKCRLETSARKTATNAKSAT